MAAGPQGDIILVGLRDFQDEKADVIQKYMADEARSLKAYGELPDTSMLLAMHPLLLCVSDGRATIHSTTIDIACCSACSPRERN